MKLSVKTIGDPNNKSLVLLHGFMGTKEDLFPLGERFKDTHYIMLIDLPGHGKSEISPNLTFDSLISSLDELIPYGSIIFGYSMGGRVALSFAEKFPEKISALILEGANPGITLEFEKEKRLRFDQQLFENWDLNNKDQQKDFLLKWYQNPLFGNLQNHPHFKELIECKLKGDPKTWKLAINALSVAKQKSLWTYLKTHQCPLLYMVGSQDHKYQNITNEIHALSNPKNFIAIVENASHNAHFENPKLFIQSLQEFIDKLPSF